MIITNILGEKGLDIGFQAGASREEGQRRSLKRKEKGGNACAMCIQHPTLSPAKSARTTSNMSTGNGLKVTDFSYYTICIKSILDKMIGIKLLWR